MPFIDKLNQLEAAKAKVLEMEQALSAERVASLARLPSDFGYTSLDSFIKALKAAQRSGGGRRVKAKPAKSAKPAKAVKAAKGSKRRRAKVTDETRAQLKAMVEAGKTGKEIAKALSVSVPTVHNIKKSLGMVKARSAASAEAPAPAPAPAT
jgi:DNA-binding NarL/FixJ family response regulator